MVISLYSQKKNETEKQLCNIITDLTPSNRLKIHRNIDHLSSGLRTLSVENRILILLIADRKDLFNLLSVRDQLTDHRIILILPDWEDETVSNGHKFYPRFMSYVDADFNIIREVFNKMMANVNN